MDVIVLADRKGLELLPLTDNTCVALLPLAGKSLLEHTLESLIDAGFRQIHLVLSPYSEEVKAVFGNGERWGLQLSYSTTRGEESPTQVLLQLKQPPSEPFLMLRGDVVRSTGLIKDFVQQAPQQSASALINGDNAFICYCYNAAAPELNSLSWTETAPIVNAVELTGKVSKLDSLAAFHQANLDAAAGRLTLLLSGHQTALGLTQGRSTEAYPQNIKYGIALIGSYCNLHVSVELHGEVVIGDNVIIDRRARLENTVVLPHSYVGELVELSNAIVRGNDLIRVDNGSIMKISDTFLLADLNAAPLSQSFGRLYNQVAGVLVLLLSTPLWLLAAGLVAVQNPAKPFISTRLRGNKIALDDFGQPNRAEFNAWECNVSAPVLRFLPRLLAVISGDLRLVGGLPVSCEQAQSGTEDWEKFAYQTWSGLIGPTQLTIPKDAPVEEKLMSDSFYRASYSLTQDFYYLLQGLRALLSRRAWL